MHSLVDTHCHLDFADFDADRHEVLRACYKNRVHDIVIPAVSQSSWHTTIALCAKNTTSIEAIKTSVKTHLALGLHPMMIDQHQPQHLDELNTLITKHKPIAVGEIGLDYYCKTLDREKQNIFFDKQLIIAKAHQLPVIIHVRKAHDECIKLLQEANVAGGIIHNFNGSIQHAFKYIELGFKLGFGGMITFERSRKLRKLAEQIPLSSIVLETDAPDLSPEKHKGERNSPEFLPLVLNAIANVKNISVTETALITTENAKSVLAID